MRIVEIQTTEIADQLLQCCDRPLARLLLKENPNVVEDGEDALIENGGTASCYQSPPYYASLHESGTRATVP